MKYNELIKAFNRDVLVRGHKIQFTGEKGDRIEHRDSLLRTYTGTMEFGEITIGIRASSYSASGHLKIDWSVNSIRDVAGTLMTIEYARLTADELESVYKVKRALENLIEGNGDVDETLEQLNFVKYTRG